MATAKQEDTPDLDGFQDIDTDLDQHPDWDWEKDGTLLGTVVKLKEVTVQRRDGEQDTRFAVTKSTIPSPLKSAVATE